MRKLFFLFAFVGLAVVVFHSCKKDKIESPGSEDNSISEIMTLEDIQTRDRILNFRDNVGNHLKSGETTSVDSAIWDMASSINYTYCGHDFEYTSLPSDSLFYELPLTNEGHILQSDIDSVYLQIISDLTIIYNAIDADIKHMIYTNIDEVGVNREGNSTTIIVISGNGIDPLFVYGSFDEGEDWMWGNNQGMCNDPTTGSDAAEEIEYLLNNPENPPSFVGREYFLDFSFRSIRSMDWRNPDDDELDNLYDFLIFFSTTQIPNYHECLSYEEMNFYLAGTANVINNYPPDGLRPIGKTFYSVNLIGSLPDDFSVCHYSVGQLVYGIRYITTDPPGDL